MARKRNIETLRNALQGAEIDLGANDKLCGCGCGAEANPKRNFRQGHDRRFIANMVNLELCDLKVTLYNNSGAKGEFTGEEMAQKLLTESGMLMFRHHLTAAENPAKRPSRAKAAKVEEPAQDEIVSEIEGSWVKVKIGRWEYDAQVTASEDQEPTEVRYVKKDGSEVFATKFTVVG